MVPASLGRSPYFAVERPCGRWAGATDGAGRRYVLAFRVEGEAAELCRRGDLERPARVAHSVDAHTVTRLVLDEEDARTRTHAVWFDASSRLAVPRRPLRAGIGGGGSRVTEVPVERLLAMPFTEGVGVLLPCHRLVKPREGDATVYLSRAVWVAPR